MAESTSMFSQEMYFEDLEVGQRAESPGRTVTEADIVAFAGVSGDFNPLHTDAVFAASSDFGERIAHGLLGLAMASGLLTRAGLSETTVGAFLGIDWKFRGAMCIGDTISVQLEVARMKAVSRMGGGIVDLDLEIVNQDGETVQSGTWRVLMRSRGGDGDQ